MAHKKKRRAATGASSESVTRNDSHHSTAPRPMPDDLPPKLRRSFHALVKAAEDFIGGGGHLLVEASLWTDDNEISSALLADRDTAAVAAVLCVTEERDDVVQA